MAHAFALWFGRFLAGAHPVDCRPPNADLPLRIGVEHLPDYLWRELGFQQPSRPDEVSRG